MKFSPLRQRIRDYEEAYRIQLPKRTPIIIRVDGKAFHTLRMVLEKTPLFKDNRSLIDDLVWPKDEEGFYSTYVEPKEEPGEGALNGVLSSSTT